MARDTSDNESRSGAMRRGEAAGTPGSPIPRTDAVDDGRDGSVRDVAEDAPSGVERTHRAGGVGDGMRTGGSAGSASGLDPTPAPPLPARGDPDEGNHGIGGERAGGTGP